MEDDYEYPTDEQLQRVREWPVTDIPGLMDYVKSLWWAPDWGWHEEGDGRYRISTGGWSGNESIIEAWEGNQMVWFICWVESRRGGHYKFEISKEFSRPGGTIR